jgi:hypothetical protein
MAANNSTETLPVGTRIVVRAGVPSPDFDDVAYDGWTGSIVEHHGKKADPRYIVEWDAATLAAMPADYVARCEAQQIYHFMACLDREQVEPA